MVFLPIPQVLRQAAVVLTCSVFLYGSALAQDKPVSFHYSLSPVCVPMDDQSVSNWFRSYSGDDKIALRLLSSRKDRAGNVHYRYRQYYHNLPVEKSMVNLHTSNDGIYALNGMAFTTAPDETTASISAEKATAIALQEVQATRYAWQDSLLQQMQEDIDPRAVLCYLPEWKTGGNLRLAYRLEIYALQPLQRTRFYIDAVNGTVLEWEELLHTLDKTGTAYTLYSGVRTITCDSVSPSEFHLKEAGRRIVTFNAQKSYAPTAVPFKDDDNTWDNVNADQDEAATDVHWGLEITYDYYKTKLSRNSYDDKGHLITGMVHTGVGYNNAHFDGSTAFFGDGDGITDNPWVSPDLCGHELSHGMTRETADLYYMDEMGALNESFSDIFGKCVEYYYAPSTFSWLLGKPIRKSGLGVRDMKDPHTLNMPRYYRGKYYYSGSADYGGVHTNSNVQNFWFYLLCEGGSGTRESDGAAYSVKAIGLDKAEQIAYSNLADYLFPLAQYKDAATYSLEAAKVLYGASSEEYRQVKEAWYAVGVLEKPSTIAEVGKAAFSVYPNPARDRVNIQRTTEIRKGSLILRDISGRTLLQQDIVQEKDLELDLSSLHPGIYQVSIREEDAEEMVSVVKW